MMVERIREFIRDHLSDLGNQPKSAKAPLSGAARPSNLERARLTPPLTLEGYSQIPKDKLPKHSPRKGNIAEVVLRIRRTPHICVLQR